MKVDSISHYKVLEELGRGGMGLVYKATDSKLERTVALKVLSDNALVTDEDRSRFYREARAAAALHHPNIATVFEIDEYERSPGESSPYIAMEFIDGQTLAEKITIGPLPLEDVISVGSSIARALKAAHDKGIVHRDIKSGNVMLTAKGDVKVVDFGLAKLSESSLLTQQGTTIGTISYMSPEQTRGKDIDHQSDIWSLGVVLYEMIAGQLPFSGDYSEATIYAILNQDPKPLTAVRTGVPMDLERIVFKCLAKDKAIRYQNVEEIPADLAAVNLEVATTTNISAYLSTQSGTAASATRATPEPANKRKTTTFVVALFVVAIAAAAATWFLKPVPEPPQRPVTRYAIELPPEQQLLPDEDSYSAIAISRDGQSIVYIGGSPKRLYLRRLDRLESKLLPGTENASRPIFSPDGKRIAFWTTSFETAIYTLELEGGISPILLTKEVSQTFKDAVWMADDSIVFSDVDCGLSRISSRGGTSEKLIVRDEGTNCLAPLLTNGSDDFLLFRRTGVTVALNLKTGEQRRHKSLGWHYLRSGYYSYAAIPDDESYDFVSTAEAQLLVAPFDVAEMELLDRPILVEGGDLNYGHVAFSDEGTFVYLKSARQGEMIWIDRNGRKHPASVDVGTADAGLPRISPYGNQIALSNGSASTGLRLTLVDRGTHRFETFRGGGIIFAPDGRSIFYSDCNAFPGCDILRMPLDMSQQPDTLVHRRPFYPSSVSPDGRYLVVTRFIQDQSMHLLDLTDNSISPLGGVLASGGSGVISPDGKWISFLQNQNGEYRAMIAPFTESPEASFRTSMTPLSGLNWSRSRPELYYATTEGMAVATYEADGETFTVTNERLLFEMEVSTTYGFDYDEKSDRFLIARSDPTKPDSIIVVRNWIAETEAAYR
jgi:serine/threonine protein kinase